MGTLNKRLSFGPQSLFFKVSSSEKKEFLEHLKSDTRVGIQIGAALVIGLFSTFMVIDPYILPPRYVGLFRMIRIGICLADAMVIIALRRGYFRKTLELIGVCVCLSVGLAIVGMVQVSGGATSPYYAGISLTIVGFGVAIPWRLRYCAISCGILYVSYFLSAVLLSDIEQMSLFFNNNAFLLTNVVMSLTMTQINYKFRLNKFLSDKKILKANEDLKVLDKAKSTFFANVSHELKTPMTLVVTPLEYAMEKITPGAASVSISLKLFETVRQNAYRLSSRISDLMDLTKSDVGKAVIQAADIPEPGEYFAKIFQSVQSLMEKKGISHECSCNGGGDLMPHCFDRTKMDKVVVNLLTNAVKFTPSGGRITMRVWDEGETLRLSVEDTGIGIPAENLKSVFERFMQVDSFSTRSYGGMGIGLSLVKEFVEMHGGCVWVESQEGKGTIFFVDLPRGRHHFRVPVAETQKGER